MTVAVYPVAVPDAQVTSEGETVEVDVQANDIGDAGAPIIVSGPSHGTARIGSIIYTPDAGFAGTDEVVYRVCSPNDQTLCDDATLTITVAGDAPPTDSVSIGTPLGPVSSGLRAAGRDGRAVRPGQPRRRVRASTGVDRPHARGTEPARHGSRGRTASSARYDRPVTTRLDVRRGDGLASRLHDRGAGDRR